MVPLLTLSSILVPSPQAVMGHISCIPSRGTRVLFVFPPPPFLRCNLHTAEFTCFGVCSVSFDGYIWSGNHHHSQDLK